MSRKYNTKHPNRSRSNYGSRLSERGLSKAPQMPTLDYLRHHQGTAHWRETHPIIVANIAAFLESAK